MSPTSPSSPVPPAAGTRLPLPMPPPALGTTCKWGLCPPTPHTSAGSGGQEPPSSGCLAQEKTRWLVLSTAEPWLPGHRIGHFHPLPIFVPSGTPLLSPPVPLIPGGPSAWLWQGLGEQEGGGGSPHGSFKKPTTGSRNQLKVTAGTCGLGSGERGRRDGGREESRMKSQPGRGDGWRRSGGEREGGVQQSGACRGVPPVGDPRYC